jgi:hypothetical protein
MDGRLLTALAVLGIGTAAAVSGSRGVVRASRAAPPDRTPYPKANPGTRLRKLEDEALRCGFVIRTHSPGDGVTRYGFFSLPDMEALAERLGEPFDPNRQSYWGPASAAKTVLGIGKAETYFKENLWSPKPRGSPGVVRRSRGVEAPDRTYLLEILTKSDFRSEIEQALDDGLLLLRLEMDAIVSDVSYVPSEWSIAPHSRRICRRVTLHGESGEYEFRKWIRNWVAGRSDVRSWDLSVRGSRGVVRRSRRGALELSKGEAIRGLQDLVLAYTDTVAGGKPIIHGKTINGWLWSGDRKIAAVPSSSFAHFFFNGLPESWVHLEGRPPEPTPMRVVKILRVSVSDPRPGGSLGVTEATTVHFSSGMTMAFFDHQEASVLGLARQAFSLLATALDVPFEETA